MSCPSGLKSAGEIFSNDDEAVELPSEFYLMTVLMVALVVGIPFIYRELWVAAWSLFSYYSRPKDLRGGPRGCRQMGRPGDRNLSMEPNTAVHSNGRNEKGKSKIEALFIYPIKSCYPVELDSSKIDETGLEFDRQFCFASWHKPTNNSDQKPEGPPQKGSSAYWNSRPHWEFLTQRQNPSLTHIKVQIWRSDPNLRDYDEKLDFVKSGGCLKVSFAYSPPMTSVSNILSLLTAKLKAFSLSAVPVWQFTVPLNPTSEQIDENGYGRDKLRIWRDEVDGIDMTSEIPRNVLRNLQLFLHQDAKQISASKYERLKDTPPELRLFRVDTTKERNVYKCTPYERQLGYQAHTGYADSYPIHIQNLASIKDAENHIPRERDFKPDSRRFRGNIYVTGETAYDEDDWTLISIGGNEFYVSCRTTRCKLPTNDPDTGLLGRDVQPYTYLAKNRAIDEGAPQSGCLGMMMVPSKQAVGKTIKVGDSLEVLKRGKHHFVADPEPEAQRPVL